MVQARPAGGQLPHAGDADERSLAPALAGLAAGRPASWRGCSRTTSPASTGRKRRCNPAPAGSTRSGSTIRSSRASTRIPTAPSSDAGVRNLPAFLTARAAHALDHVAAGAGGCALPDRPGLSRARRGSRADARPGTRRGYGECARSADYGATADAIQDRHGSRRSGLPQPRPGGQSQAVSLHCSSNQ